MVTLKFIEIVILWSSLLYLFNIEFVYSTSNTEDVTKYVRSNEICSIHNGRRIYLEPGDGGILQATNITVPNYFNKYLNNTQFINSTNLPYQCSIEIITCASCIIKIKMRYMNFTTNCLKQNDEYTTCNCNYLWLSEPPYDSVQYGKRICGDVIQYISKTRTLSIKYIYQTNDSHVFTLDYLAERNREELFGTPNNSSQRKHLQTITTPFFPALYPRDYEIETIIKCHMENCHIRVIFTDYQIAVISTMEFFDWNGERIEFFTGNIFRPPVIISKGPSIVIRFFANGGTALGYTAEITYLTTDQIQDISVQPNMNCGGIVESIGGAITMMDMVVNKTDLRYYDCIWLIKSSQSYLHMKTHILLRVETFTNMGIGSDLVIRQGITSDRPDIERFFYFSEINQLTTKTYVVPLTMGFYISLRGFFNYESRLALVYTTFSYMDCYIGSEFLCKNHRCIPIHLHCDGFDHCGDNSDEPVSCVTEWTNKDPIEKSWYTHTPNYLFPKMDNYPDLKTATLVFIFSCLGLIFIISTLIILLLRIGNRARHQRELQNHLQTISELLESNSTQPEELPPEEPPAYEAPPDYEEVITVGMEDQMNVKLKNNRSSDRNKTRNIRSRSCQSNTCGGGGDGGGAVAAVNVNYENPILQIILPVIDVETASSSNQNDNNNNNMNSIHEQSNLTLSPHNNFSDNFLAGTQLIETTKTFTNEKKSSIISHLAINKDIPDSPPPAYPRPRSSFSSIQSEHQFVPSTAIESTSNQIFAEGFFNSLPLPLSLLSAPTNVPIDNCTTALQLVPKKPWQLFSNVDQQFSETSTISNSPTTLQPPSKSTINENVIIQDTFNQISPEMREINTIQNNNEIIPTNSINLVNTTTAAVATDEGTNDNHNVYVPIRNLTTSSDNLLFAPKSDTASVVNCGKCLKLLKYKSKNRIDQSTTNDGIQLFDDLYCTCIASKMESQIGGNATIHHIDDDTDKNDKKTTRQRLYFRRSSSADLLIAACTPKRELRRTNSGIFNVM